VCCYQRSSCWTCSGLEAAFDLYLRKLLSPCCNTSCVDAGTERQIKQTQSVTTLQHPVHQTASNYLPLPRGTCNHWHCLSVCLSFCLLATSCKTTEHKNFTSDKEEWNKISAVICFQITKIQKLENFNSRIAALKQSCAFVYNSLQSHTALACRPTGVWSYLYMVMSYTDIARYSIFPQNGCNVLSKCFCYQHSALLSVTYAV